MAKKKPKVRGIERKIYFYKVTSFVNGVEVKFDAILNDYISLLNGDYHDLEDRRLAIPHFEKYHFLDVNVHEIDPDVYLGKFYSLRSTDFPYLFNIGNGDRSEISYSEQDTLMEQTHFYCFTTQHLIVSEFNFYGARIERLGEYLTQIMEDLYPSKRYEIKVLPIVIPEYFEQIVNCTSISKVQFKVAHPGLAILAEENIIALSDIARSNLEESSDFYIDIELSGGGRGKHLPIKNIKEFMCKIISAIKKGNAYDANKSDDDEVAFRKAKIKGYNPNEAKIIPYDLLDEKLVHTCYVEKISNRSKYVDSDKMFKELLDAYRSKRDDARRYMGAL